MRVILVGYEGSRCVRKASQYLVEKYIPYETVWLEHTGSVIDWSKFVLEYLESIPDEEVIFALDDYLIACKMKQIAKPSSFDCIKLCEANDEENEGYPITTQYTLWKKEYLMEILKWVNTPWEFELKGSSLHKAWDKMAYFIPVLKYYTNSSLSSKWEGIDLTGLNEEDIKEVQKFI